MDLKDKVSQSQSRNPFERKNSVVPALGAGFASIPTVPPVSRARHGSSNAPALPANLPPSVVALVTAAPGDPSKGKGGGGGGGGRHVVCAIAENLSREVCIVTLDASRPSTLVVTKQSNSLSFNETLIALDLIAPDEILLNEGRKSSVLARKVYDFFDGAEGEGGDHETVVKFVSRGCFEQTRGAEMLRKAARKSTYNPEVRKRQREERSSFLFSVPTRD